MCVAIWPTSISLLHIPTEARRGFRPPETGVTGDRRWLSTNMWVLGMNWSPVEEQALLLTIEPSFHTFL